jgi:hypothetical protein
MTIRRTRGRIRLLYLGQVAMAKKTCPLCGKEVNIIPFGNRYIAVCCKQIIYVGYEPPRETERVGIAKIQPVS